jgi:hypothetical protein
MPNAFALRPVLVVVAAKCAVNLAVAGRYGWQRDELYYAVAGRHLQGGYVEFPPVTALLSALARVLFAWSLVGFRAFAILAVVLVLLLAAVLIWRRDVLRSGGFPLAVAIAAALLVPNLVWEARHDWTSVHWFVNPPSSATDESRPLFVGNVLLLTHLVAVPVAIAGIVSLARDRALRPLGWTAVGTVLAYLVLGGKSYYALPAVLFALAAGAVPFDRWATTRRLRLVGSLFVAFLVVTLPLGLPVLPLRTADRLGIVDARSDYQDEVGWHRFARDVERHAHGTDVVVTLNYGEAGALELFGHDLPPVASGHVTFRYWRPQVAGRRAVVVGFTRADADFCRGYRVVARIRMPVENEERGRPIARCTLAEGLAQVWPQILAEYGS